MAASDEATRKDGRGLLTAGLVVLTAVTGAAFGRVFRGAGPSMRLIVAAVAATVVAALLERRHLALSLLFSAAGLVLAVGLLVFPDTTFAGLPTADTLRAIGEALGRVGRQAVEEFAPAPARPPLMMAAVTAAWAASTAAHALASRAGGSIMALVPCAALAGFAQVVTGDGPRPGYAISFLAASILVLFGASVRRLGVWGPILPLSGEGRWRAAAGPTERARRLALGSVAVALLVPWVLPGFRSGPIWNIGGGAGSDRVSIDPIVDIRPSLRQNPPVELFNVRAARPAYWRLLAVDVFDGRQWSSRDLTARHAELRTGTGALAGAASVQSVALEQVVEIGALAVPWLPAAYQPVTLELGDDVRIDDPRTAIVRPGGTERGLRYRVRSQLVVPRPEDLAKIEPDLTQDPIARANVLLPAGVPAQIHDLAREITAEVDSMYERVLAVQEYLRAFTYDEDARPGHGANDIVHFLRTQRGYCEQFAGTMAVLLRSLSIPSRVAVGFTPGSPDQGGLYRVTTQQAHAWTEVYFPGFGWLAFEPTPTRSNPVGTRYQFPPLPSGTRYVGEAGLTQDGGLGPSGEHRDPAGLRGSPPGLQSVPEPSPWPRVVVLAAVAMVAALVLVPLVKAGVRRVAMARALTARDVVSTAFRIFESGAADVGLGRRPGETFWEYRGRLQGTVAFRGSEMERLAGLAGRAAYSPRHLGRHQAEEARSAARTLGQEVRRHVGIPRACLGALRLRIRSRIA